MICKDMNANWTSNQMQGKFIYERELAEKYKG